MKKAVLLLAVLAVLLLSGYQPAEETVEPRYYHGCSWYWQQIPEDFLDGADHIVTVTVDDTQAYHYRQQIDESFCDEWYTLFAKATVEEVLAGELRPGQEIRLAQGGDGIHEMDEAVMENGGYLKKGTRWLLFLNPWETQGENTYSISTAAGQYPLDNEGNILCQSAFSKEFFGELRQVGDMRTIVDGYLSETAPLFVRQDKRETGPESLNELLALTGAVAKVSIRKTETGRVPNWMDPSAGEIDAHIATAAVEEVLWGDMEAGGEIRIAQPGDNERTVYELVRLSGGYLEEGRTYLLFLWGIGRERDKELYGISSVAGQYQLDEQETIVKGQRYFNRYFEGNTLEAVRRYWTPPTEPVYTVRTGTTLGPEALATMHRTSSTTGQAALPSGSTTVSTQ